MAARRAPAARRQAARLPAVRLRSDGPFAAIGLENGDLLLEVNGTPIATPDAALAASPTANGRPRLAGDRARPPAHQHRAIDQLLSRLRRGPGSPRHRRRRSLLPVRVERGSRRALTLAMPLRKKLSSSDAVSAKRGHLVLGGGYVPLHPAGTAQEAGDGRRARQARRHLPERRLHPLEGADQRGASITTSSATARTSASSPTTSASTCRKMQTWKGEVVSKLTGGVQQLLKANGCDYRTGTRPLAVAQHRRADRGERRSVDDPGRQHRGRDRLAADRDPGLQVRRQPHRRFDGRARTSTRSPSASS